MFSIEEGHFDYVGLHERGAVVCEGAARLDGAAPRGGEVEGAVCIDVERYVLPVVGGGV